jgi:arabinosaccharide transport system substrate-binding protein
MRRLRDWMDGVPLGLAPMVMLAVLVLAGAWLLANPVPKKTATLRLWTFTHIHADAYRQAAPAFEAKHPGVKVDIQLVHGDAVTSRLRAAFWAGLDVPDLVEVEISRAGSFFRGPVEEVGFLDLTERLRESGLYERIVPTRFAPYTNRGKIFGLPHDVHPVMLAYRRDLFEELGIDPARLQTWDDFIREGRRVTNRGERHMIHLSASEAYNVEMFLFQRGGGYFDPDGNLIMDEEIAVQTMQWYIPLVAGPDRIGADPGFWGQPFARAMEDGYTLSFVCPDWKSRSTEKDIPRLSGRMALMPLPAFEPGGRRTSTWGGTMLGITTASADPDLAWKFAMHIYYEPDQLADAFRETNILPPLKDAWRLPAVLEPRPYWSGQPLGKLYADLAGQVPPQYASPFTELAKAKMGAVVAACASYYNTHGERGFDEFVRARLKQAADDVRRQMTRNPF